MTNHELENKLLEIWGQKYTSVISQNKIYLADKIDFYSLTDENCSYLLDLFLKRSFSSIGSLSIDNDNLQILNTTRKKLYEINSNSRRIDPVLRCYDLLSESFKFDGSHPLATIYLIAELEHCLKTNSKYLNREGIIIKQLPNSLRKKLSSHNYLPGKRINQISDILNIYCYRNNNNFSQYLKSYDKELKKAYKIIFKDKYNIVDGKKVKVKFEIIKLSERINMSRNLIMHGEASFMHTEYFFYLTLHSLFYLGNKSFYLE